MPGKQQKFLLFLSLALLALLGFFSIIFLTSGRGIGIVSDSGAYYVLAQYFLNSSIQDLCLPKVVILHFSPFFPFILALCSRLSGLDSAEACRWLQACLFGFNILLVGSLLARYTKSALISIGGACAVFISVPILLNHSSMLSEPMFILFMLLWLVFFMDFIEASSKSSFILCIMALMAACLTRWAGVTLVLTSIVGIFLFKKGSVKTRCIHTAVLMSASLLPLLLWMARNAIFTGMAIDRKFVFHPHAVAEYNILHKVTFLGIHNIFFSGVNGLVLIAVMFFIGMIIWDKRDKEEMAKIPEGVFIFIGVLFYFCLIYYISIILTLNFFDDLVSMDDRILLPLSICWILLVSLFLYILLVSNKKCKFLKRVFIILCLFVGGSNFFMTTQWAYQRYYNGVGFEGKKYDDLKIIAEVKKIPSDKILYTNNSDTLYLSVKRYSRPLISKVNLDTTRFNPAYPVLMAKMKDDLRAHKAVLVYFNSMDFKQESPSLEELKKEIPLKAIVSVSDGTIYVWDDKT